MKSPQNSQQVSGSFRDPSGFLFNRDGLLYRQVNAFYKDNYDCLMASGLYQALVDAGLLIVHNEINTEPAQPDKAYKIIKPELIEFISYPYEWCFSQLKDAAVLLSYGCFSELSHSVLTYSWYLKSNRMLVIMLYPFEGRPTMEYSNGKPPPPPPPDTDASVIIKEGGKK